LLGVVKSVPNAVQDNVIPVINASKYCVTHCIVTNATASLAQATGGLYSAPSAGGTTVVTAAALSTATTALIAFLMTVAAPTIVLTGPNLYWRETVVNTAAATYDVYVYGFCFD
jgi:hypothetical protein